MTKPSAPAIPKGPEGEAVRNAFTKYNLDPNNPDHWFKLLNVFVRPVRKPGALKKWSYEKLMKLWLDFLAIRQEHPGKTDTRLCQLLVKKGGDYAHMNPDRLRSRVHDAFLKVVVKRYQDKFVITGENSQKQLRSWLASMSKKPGVFIEVPQGLSIVQKSK